MLYNCNISLTKIYMENQNFSYSTNNKSETTAKDFFLHLGMIVSLYATVIAFLNLLFKVIDKAFPNMITKAYYWSRSSEISMPVATLIVVFPIFVFLSWLVYKSYEENQSKKNLGIRKWLIYITLFVAGIILAGDLVSVIYKFLDGQDLTSAFLLKSLSVFVVIGAVFGYFLCDLRDKMTSQKRKIWTVSVSVLILLAVVFGFSVMGSPRTQRLLRYDDQKVSDLQNIQWQVISHWQTYGTVPSTIQELNNSSSINYYNLPKDPQTGEDYGYIKTSELGFEICADFNRANKKENSQIMPMYVDRMGTNENWQHEEGRQCFSRTIDPILYPTRIKG